MSEDIRGWILYDDCCGFCRRWIPFWRKTLQRRGYDIAPLQSDWVREKIILPQDELTSDLRLLFADGTHIQGADVYRHVMAHIWWAIPLFLFSIAPGTRRIFDWSYQTFARNRFRFSRACGLPNHAE